MSGGQFIFSILSVVLAIVGCIGVGLALWYLTKRAMPHAPVIHRVLGLSLFVSCVIFIFGLDSHASPHYAVIDPFVNPCYSPISYRYSFGLAFLHVASLVSILLLYSKGLKMPPLVATCCIIIMTIGIALDSFFVYQVTYHDTSGIWHYADGHTAVELLVGYPAMLVLISIAIQVRLIRAKSVVNNRVRYRSRVLNFLNQRLIASGNLPLFAMFLTIPFLLIIVLLLILFGQDMESIQKVFTDTATWRLSQELHPPTVDDRHGHYLCTVAARGNPALVKPVHLGRRNGQVIIVNRQLQVANAFEQMIEELAPKAHRCIRSAYDAYGLNLSKRVNSVARSNITYIIMKPLEWIFLIFLYAYYTNPEKVITRQYRVM